MGSSLSKVKDNTKDACQDFLAFEDQTVRDTLNRLYTNIQDDPKPEFVTLENVRLTEGITKQIVKKGKCIDRSHRIDDTLRVGCLFFNKHRNINMRYRTLGGQFRDYVTDANDKQRVYLFCIEYLTWLSSLRKSHNSAQEINTINEKIGTLKDYLSQIREEKNTKSKENQASTDEINLANDIYDANCFLGNIRSIIESCKNGDNLGNLFHSLNVDLHKVIRSFRIKLYVEGINKNPDTESHLLPDCLEESHFSDLYQNCLQGVRWEQNQEKPACSMSVNNTNPPEVEIIRAMELNNTEALEMLQEYCVIKSCYPQLEPIVSEQGHLVLDSNDQSVASLDDQQRFEMLEDSTQAVIDPGNQHEQALSVKPDSDQALTDYQKQQYQLLGQIKQCIRDNRSQSQWYKMIGRHCDSDSQYYQAMAILVKSSQHYIFLNEAAKGCQPMQNLLSVLGEVILLADNEVSAKVDELLECYSTGVNKAHEMLEGFSDLVSDIAAKPYRDTYKQKLRTTFNILDKSSKERQQVTEVAEQSQSFMDQNVNSVLESVNSIRDYINKIGQHSYCRNVLRDMAIVINTLKNFREYMNNSTIKPVATEYSTEYLESMGLGRVKDVSHRLLNQGKQNRAALFGGANPSSLSGKPHSGRHDSGRQSLNKDEKTRLYERAFTDTQATTHEPFSNERAAAYDERKNPFSNEEIHESSSEDRFAHQAQEQERAQTSPEAFKGQVYDRLMLIFRVNQSVNKAQLMEVAPDFIEKQGCAASAAGPSYSVISKDQFIALRQQTILSNINAVFERYNQQPINTLQDLTDPLDEAENDDDEAVEYATREEVEKDKTDAEDLSSSNNITLNQLQKSWFELTQLLKQGADLCAPETLHEIARCIVAQAETTQSVRETIQQLKQLNQNEEDDSELNESQQEATSDDIRRQDSAHVTESGTDPSSCYDNVSQASSSSLQQVSKVDYQLQDILGVSDIANISVEDWRTIKRQYAQAVYEKVLMDAVTTFINNNKRLQSVADFTDSDASRFGQLLTKEQGPYAIRELQASELEKLKPLQLLDQLVRSTKKEGRTIARLKETVPEIGLKVDKSSKGANSLSFRNAQTKQASMSIDCNVDVNCFLPPSYQIDFDVIERELLPQDAIEQMSEDDKQGCLTNCKTAPLQRVVHLLNTTYTGYDLDSFINCAKQSENNEELDTEDWQQISQELHDWFSHYTSLKYDALKQLAYSTSPHKTYPNDKQYYKSKYEATIRAQFDKIKADRLKDKEEKANAEAESASETPQQFRRAFSCSTLYGTQGVITPIRFGGDESQQAIQDDGQRLSNVDFQQILRDIRNHYFDTCLSNDADGVDHNTLLQSRSFWGKPKHILYRNLTAILDIHDQNSLPIDAEKFSLFMFAGLWQSDSEKKMVEQVTLSYLNKAMENDYIELPHSIGAMACKLLKLYFNRQIQLLAQPSDNIDKALVAVDEIIDAVYSNHLSKRSTRPIELDHNMAARPKASKQLGQHLRSALENISSVEECITMAKDLTEDQDSLYEDLSNILKQLNQQQDRVACANTTVSQTAYAARQSLDTVIRNDEQVEQQPNGVGSINDTQTARRTCG